MSLESSLREGTNWVQRNGPSIDKVLQAIKNPAVKVSTLPRTAVIYTLCLLLPFIYASCGTTRKSDTVRTEDIAQASFSAAQYSKNLTLKQRASLQFAEVLIGNIGDNERARDSANVTNIYPQDKSQTSNQTGIYMETIDWNHLLNSGRIQSRDGHNGKVTIALPFKWDTSGKGEYVIQHDIFILNRDGTDIERLTTTPWENETNVAFTNNGNDIQYDSEHIPFISENGDCDIEYEKSSKKLYCQAHPAFIKKRMKKTLNLATRKTSFKNPKQIPFNQGHLTKHR